MPRLMSFAHTTDQIRNRTKTVTRRNGWADLKPGELFWAVEKAMGLKPGEKVKRVHFRERETFDSSATPKVGGKVITPQRMAEVDLDALGAAIKATVEKAKADDPKALRAKIADLERKVDKSARGVQTDPAAIEKARLAGEAAGAAARDKEWRPIVDQLKRTNQDLAGRMGKAEKKAAELASLLQVNGEATPEIVYPSGKAIPAAPARKSFTHQVKENSGQAVAVAPQRVVTRIPERRSLDSGSDSGDLGKGPRIVLTAIAQHTAGVSREQLTVLTGYKRSSRDTYLQLLRQRALIADEVGTD
jgi:hypothetical protein